MTIYSQQLNPTPMAQTELSVTLSTSSVSVPTAENVLDYCFCDYDCDFRELVFAGANDYQTDRSAFLFENPDQLNGSVVIEIINVATGAETVIMDDNFNIHTANNAYGVFYPLGDFTTQPLKGGYQINWGLIRDVIGFARYRFRITQNFFGQSIIKETHIYDLKPYDIEYAFDTVRIETQRDGCIEGGIDYTGLNWLTQVRIPGKFGFKEARLERDFFTTNTRAVAQVQDQVINTYDLRTSLLPSFIMDPLLEDGFMASTIFITDYNGRSYNDIRQLEVVATEYSESTEYYDSRYGKFVIKFEEKTQNLIKRN